MVDLFAPQQQSQIATPAPAPTVSPINAFSPQRGPVNGTGDRVPVNLFEELNIPAREINFIEGAERSFANTLLDGVLGTGEIFAQFAADSLPNLANTFTGGFVGEPLDIETARRQRADERGRILPTGQDVRGGFRAATDVLTGGDISGSLERGIEAEQAADARFQSEAPAGTMVGSLGADVATILSGRGLARSLRNNRVRRPRPERSNNLAGRIRRQLDTVWDSKPVQALARGAGKAGETGLEGAALAIISDGDPLEVGALAAGGQVAGSVALATSGLPDLVRQGKRGRGLLTFAITAASIAGIARLAQEFSPGQNNSFEALDVGYSKVALGLLAGATSAVLGMGRVRGSLQQNLPVVADAITSIPRTAALSAIVELRRDAQAGNDTTARILDMAVQRPDLFSAQQTRFLNRAMTDEKVSLSGTVERLLRDGEFRQRLESFNQ